MTPEQLLASLRQRGVRVSLEAGQRLVAEGDDLTDEDIEQLRAHKVAVIALLAPPPPPQRPPAVRVRVGRPSSAAPAPREPVAHKEVVEHGDDQAPPDPPAEEPPAPPTTPPRRGGWFYGDPGVEPSPAAEEEPRRSLLSQLWHG